MLQRVVLIDDNETTNLLNRRLLTKLGVTHDITVYQRPLEAYRALWGPDADAHQLPELVFVDLHMPGMTGVEFLELYQQLPPEVRAKSRLVVLTTSMLNADREQVGRFADIEYLVKPLSREKVTKLLTTHFPHVEIAAN